MSTSASRSTAALAFVAVALATALAPLLGQTAPAAGAPIATAFPGWPAEHDGLALVELPLGARDRAFGEGFPGRVARFTDGRREIILRWVAAPTRKLHPASDCLKAVGYAITPLPARQAASGQTKACFRAAKADSTLTVCEHVRDAAGHSWPDISAWYWSAAVERTQGPWWAIVEAEAL